MTLDELQRHLESLPDKVEQNVAPVLKEQAELLSDAQRQALRSLERDPAETGNLEASCQVVIGDDPLDVHVVAGGDLTLTEVRTGSGEPYDYALGFEYGTSHQSAQPFFWPTYRARKDDISEAINTAINEALK